MDYADFRTCFRRRDNSLFKKRTLQTMKKMFYVIEYFDRMINEMDFSLREINATESELTEEEKIKRGIWSTIQESRSALLEEAETLYEKMNKMKDHKNKKT